MPDAALAEVENAATRLRQWLLHRAVSDSGPFAGAVIGSFEPDGRMRYVYPECAGYYLSWLAWLNATGQAPPNSAERARSIADWLQHWCLIGHPTRLTPVLANDWRNRGQFAFDLAMLLRGVAAASNQGLLPLASARALVFPISTRLCELIDKRGELSAVRVLEGELPRRWSTLAGPYQAKVGAAVLLAARSLSLPSVLVAAANSTLQRSAREASAAIHPDCAHAALYGLEGLSMGLALGVVDRTVESNLLLRLGEWRELISYWLSARLSAPLEIRYDVLAQWSRLAKRHLSAESLINQVDKRLHDSIGADGSLPFAHSPFDQGACTWAALFCDQALSAIRLQSEDLL